MLTALRTDWRARLRLLAARWLVDTDFYLDRYPDIRAAGIDPVRHFAEHGLAVPIRAANAVMERAIIRGAPLLGLAALLLGTRRTDWVQCFVERYQYLACGNLGVEYRFARWVARLLATVNPARVTLDPSDRDRILGKVLSVVRLEASAFPWLTVSEIDPPTRYCFDGPRLWGDSKPPSVHSVMLPALWCATIRQASVFGSMQIAAHGHFLRYEPAADPNLSYSAGQYRHVITCFSPRHDKVLARVPDQAAAHVDAAILLGGRCGNNHFHFLIEYLTKGYVIERAGLYEGLPMIVPDDLFPAQLEAIRLLFPERDLIAISAAQRLDVECLHIPSLMTYFPDAMEIADCEKEGLRHASLQWLRDRTLAALPPEPEHVDPIPRLYLSRRRGRNIVNAAEVEADFIDHGFKSIDPSGLTFAQQVRLFANATHVAGPVGAAFANTVFCKPGTAIIHLGSRHARTSTLFQNLAAFAECPCIRLMSDRTIGDMARMNSNVQSLRQGSYEINQKSLRSLLDAWAPRR
ncbi:glycosyltransferase family 61 protein [Methylobacterium sp. J-048]|uniref:glycosyltransferase family 61 protein n=1 Tax=Methylobacterium sp. J-048 TaxID=2836635 RepID=UPI001FB94C29|nr:glycosyltransferase family 61 protein [Methylobacterium sp. J-048]MCJ2058678.1 glycosyltransferase family 61 protein [Methylobacterium sp. J-048]